MFASVLSSIVRSTDVAHTTTLLLDVVGHTYRVELHRTKNGVSFYVHAGGRSKRTNTCTTAARAILRRELRRKGLTRAPHAIAVTALATLIHDGIVRARDLHAEEQAQLEMEAYHNQPPRVLDEVAALKAEMLWRSEHPYAGACGDDDALADRLAALLA